MASLDRSYLFGHWFFNPRISATTVTEVQYQAVVDEPTRENNWKTHPTEAMQSTIEMCFGNTFSSDFDQK